MMFANVLKSSLGKSRVSSARARRSIHSTRQQGMPIKHIVMFRFADDTPPDQVETIRGALLELPQKIQQINDYEVGKDIELPAGQEHPLGKNRMLSWSATFDSVEDYQTYDNSEAHQEFLQKLRPIVDKTSRAAIQYEIE